MKLDSKTMTVMKSFAGIQQSLLFRKGNILSTMTGTRTIFAKAKLDQEFTKEFAIYDLARFLGVLSLFKDPDIALEKSWVRISSDKQRARYTFAAPETIVSAPEILPSPTLESASKDVKCTLTQAALKSIRDATAALGAPEIAITGEEGRIFLQAMDSKNDTSDVFSMEIGETKKEFRAVIKPEYISKLLPQDYAVVISKAGFAHWKGEFVEYWLTVEKAPSEFGKL